MAASVARRAKLRARRLAAVAAYRQRVAELRAAGASCASCRDFSKAPPSFSGHVCDRHSDRDGYLITTADGLCPDHARRAEPVCTGTPNVVSAYA